MRVKRFLSPRSAIMATLGLFLLDRALKAFALASGGRGDVPLIGEAVQFTLFRNGGIAFSLPFSGPLVWLASVAILAVVAAAARRDFRAGRQDRAAAFALFVFGACSNLFDRVVYGFTVDYLLFFGRSAVNVADAMIVAGALLLVLADRGRQPSS